MTNSTLGTKYPVNIVFNTKKSTRFEVELGIADKTIKRLLLKVTKGPSTQDPEKLILVPGSEKQLPECHWQLC